MGERTSDDVAIGIIGAPAPEAAAAVASGVPEAAAAGVACELLAAAPGLPSNVAAALAVLLRADGVSAAVAAAGGGEFVPRLVDRLRCAARDGSEATVLRVANNAVMTDAGVMSAFLAAGGVDALLSYDVPRLDADSRLAWTRLLHRLAATNTDARALLYADPRATSGAWAALSLGTGGLVASAAVLPPEASHGDPRATGSAATAPPGVCYTHEEALKLLYCLASRSHPGDARRELLPANATDAAVASEALRAHLVAPGAGSATALAVQLLMVSPPDVLAAVAADAAAVAGVAAAVARALDGSTAASDGDAYAARRAAALAALHAGRALADAEPSARAVLRATLLRPSEGGDGDGGVGGDSGAAAARRLAAGPPLSAWARAALQSPDAALKLSAEEFAWAACGGAAHDFVATVGIGCAAGLLQRRGQLDVPDAL